ncbi:MAG: two-CW domain-containing protein [Candidatus Omnitrophota bacterium]
MTKLNCWEFMKCGREVGGKNVEQLGVCSAATETKTNGIHGGINGGRCCWAIAGTLCDGKTQGTFVDKFMDCTKCPFYALVTEEEKKYIIVSEIRDVKDIRKIIEEE